MSRQLSCRDMYKIGTWLDHYFLFKSSLYFNKIWMMSSESIHESCSLITRGLPLGQAEATRSATELVEIVDFLVELFHISVNIYFLPYLNTWDGTGSWNASSWKNKDLSTTAVVPCAKFCSNLFNYDGEIKSAMALGTAPGSCDSSNSLSWFEFSMLTCVTWCGIVEEHIWWNLKVSVIETLLLLVLKHISISFKLCNIVSFQTLLFPNNVT